MKTVTCAQMKQIEKNANASGLTYQMMMENAGASAAGFIAEQIPPENKQGFIFVGKGNNGGDGLVVARKLSQQGAKITVILVDGIPKTTDGRFNYDRLPGTVSVVSMELPSLSAQMEQADFIVDAIYGTGFHGILYGQAKQAALLIRRCKAPVFSLDIPSGINGDTGEYDPHSIRADYTIVFDSFKPAHADSFVAHYFGHLELADIGIDASCRNV